MTVSSLWKALDRAGSGRCVGAKELQNHHRFRDSIHNQQKTNPWNIRQVEQQQAKDASNQQRPALAIDLSIWICEALTSNAMQQNHVVDPALQLVYSRTLKLLNLGIKLVVVVEGKRRIRRKAPDGDENENDGSGKQSPQKQQDKFRKRRSGAPFWAACQRCETMLKALGVPVVRAKAEGEALCALLNQRGIVDGVISNDGDCFLFGAKVLYTKFSIDNLEQSRVVRYDADDIRACLDDDDADKLDETGEKCEDGNDIVKMTRDDLIAFAILTGSDLAGDGLDKVGCRKAIRFIRKCRIDNPLKLNESPAINELISWGNTAARGNTTLCAKGDDEAGGKKTTTCGCCGHPGNKKSHKKHGCDVCGTGPGEDCFLLSPGAKFRKSLRSKALDMGTSFDPSSTIELYNQPNENQLPLLLVGKTSRNLEMQAPQLQSLLRLKFVIRGGSIHDSRQYIQKTVSAYMARTALFVKASAKAHKSNTSKLPKNSNRPTPVRITKFVTRLGIPCCEVQWVIKATLTDDEGNPIDQLEFSTIEEQQLIQDTYPDLILNFKGEIKKFEAQGSAEQEKRQAFIVGMLKNSETASDPAKIAKKRKPRRSLVEGPITVDETQKKVKGRGDDLKTLLFDPQKASRSRPNSRVEKRASPKEQKKRLPTTNVNANEMKSKPRKGPISSSDNTKCLEMNEKKQVQIPKRDGKLERSKNNALNGHGSCGDDIAMMLEGCHGPQEKRSDDSTIDTASVQPCSPAVQDRQVYNAQNYRDEVLTPGHIHFLNGSNDSRRRVASEESDDRHCGDLNALCREMYDIAEEPVGLFLFENDKSNFNQKVETTEDVFNNPTADRMCDSHPNDMFQVESIPWLHMKEDLQQNVFDQETENQINGDRPQSFGDALQKRHRQASRRGVQDSFTSNFTPATNDMNGQRSAFVFQETTHMQKSSSRSPLLKKRKEESQQEANLDSWQHRKGMFGSFSESTDETFFRDSTTLRFDDFAVDVPNCDAPWGHFEPLISSENQTSHLWGDYNLDVEASSTSRGECRRPHSSPSVEVRKHRPKSSNTSRRPFSSQSRSQGAVLQDRTNTQDYDLGNRHPKSDMRDTHANQHGLSEEYEWNCEEKASAYYGRRRPEAKKTQRSFKRKDNSNRYASRETDVWHFESEFESVPSSENNFFEFKYSKPRSPRTKPRRNSRDERNFDARNDFSYRSNDARDYRQSESREVKNKPRKSLNKDYDDSVLQSDFGEPVVSKDPFINSILKGSYFDHRDDKEASFHASGRQNKYSRKSGDPLEAWDDDFVDSEVRRRVEMKMEYARQQVAINELVAESASFGFQDDSWGDFGNI